MVMEYKELDKKEIGARIRARRESLGMTREDLGRMLDVTGKFVADIEYGEKALILLVCPHAMHGTMTASARHSLTAAFFTCIIL